jgi:Recombination endonuclease VII
VATDPKERARDLTLQRTYGITLEEYKSILAAQGHKCPICQKTLSGWSNPVDHDHLTGIVRGITCTYCNRRRIGQHNDWAIVQRMADYLRRPPAGRIIGSRAVPKKKKRRTSVRPKARSDLHR